MAFNERIAITIDVLADKAIGGLNKLKSVVSVAGQDLDDTASAGKRMAAALDAATDQIAADMQGAERAAGALAASLGPEMAAQIGRNGIDSMLAKLRAAGLTFDEVEADADALAVSLRRMDAVAGTANVSDGLDKVSTSSDRARGAVGGFVGGAVSELPLVAGAFGPVSQGLDQMVSSLVEGDMKFKQLLAAGLAMAAAGIVISELTDKTEELEDAARKAMNAKLVKDWSDALRDSSGAIDGLTAKLADSGRAYVQMFGPDGDALWVDWTERFNTGGITVEAWAAAIAGGARGAADFEEALRASSLPAFEQETILRTLVALQETYAKAAKVAGESTEYLGNAQAETMSEADRLAQAVGRGGVAATAATVAHQALTKALERNEEAQHSLTNTRLAAIDQDFAYRASVDGLAVALESYAKATDDPATATNELAMSQDAAAQAAINMATNYRTSAEQLQASAGAPLTAAEGQQKFIESLYQTALALDPSSPLRAQLVGYITMLQDDIPVVAETKIIAETTDALDRIGGVQEAVDELDGSETNTDSKAKTDTALTAVQTLTTAIEGVPTSITTVLGLDGFSSTMGELAQLLTRLREVTTEADRADRAVGRVAG